MTPVLGHVSRDPEAYFEVVGILAGVLSSDLKQLIQGSPRRYRREVLWLRLGTMVPLIRRHCL